MLSGKLVFSVSHPQGSGGDVQFAWQNGRGGYLAATGSEQSIFLYNRSGEVKKRIQINGLCTGLTWDSDGDILSVIVEKSTQLLLWDLNAERAMPIDSGLRDPLSYMVWAKTGPILAVGTSKGNLIIYNHTTSKRLSVLGKHSKKITCGAWSVDNLLALGSEDRTLSISGPEGETQKVLTLRGEPSHVCFSKMKGDERVSGENTVSVLVGKKMLLLYNLQTPDNPVELVFQQKYGSVVKYEWFGDGYILLGFSAGYFVVISTHIKEIGHELFQVKNHRNVLRDIALSEALSVVGSCGDNVVKCHDMGNLQEASTVITVSEGAEEEMVGENAEDTLSKRKVSRLGRLQREEIQVNRMSWSGDGQLLAVSAGSQSTSLLRVYLSTLPTVHSVTYASGGKLALLTNVCEVTISGPTKDMPTENITIDLEPSFLAIGPLHLAAGKNNHAWFYSLVEEIKDFSLEKAHQSVGSSLIGSQEYMGNIQSLKLGAKYVSAMFHPGKIQLHLIPGCTADDEQKESRLFPSHISSDVTISCHSITPQFLVYGTDKGGIYYFSLEDWNEADDYQHGIGIKNIYTDPVGVCLVFIDERNEAYVFNAANSEVTKINEFPLTAAGVMWENWLKDKNVFGVFDGEKITTYIYLDNSVDGTAVEEVGQTPIVKGHLPLLLFNGEVTVRTPGGHISTVVLNTHEIKPVTNLEPKEMSSALQENLKKYLALRKLDEAWEVCLALSSQSHWNELAEAALKCLDIDFVAICEVFSSSLPVKVIGCQHFEGELYQGPHALRTMAELVFEMLADKYLTSITVYRQMGNVGMVWSLESIQGTEDRFLLAGHVSVCLRNFSKAQEWFLQSGEPLAALEMRRDLLQWEQALQLARKLAPEQVHYISREYAQQLEIMGCYSEALLHYDQSRSAVEKQMMDEESSKDKIKEYQKHISLCDGGIARCSLRCGDIRKGVAIASEASASTQLKRDCADILDSLKQYPDAAILYESGGFYEKAASLYIKLKNWKKVGDLLHNIISPKIHVQYAKAKEAEKKYKEAAGAYETAKDFENVIRICLDHLGDPDRAIRIVKETNSTEGAKMVARFFQNLNDYSSAIQFLVMSGKVDEAFRMAKSHGRMELYAQILEGDKIMSEHEPSLDDFRNVALHFESQKNSLLAGKYYFRAKDFPKALKHLLRVARSNSESEDEALTLATELVGEAGDEQLATQLIDFLLGEPDGIPKDPKYVFQLYMARKQYDEAAKTALIIANEEQNAGNYRHAHSVLYSMCRELRRKGLRVASEMQEGLALLHSYALVRLHVKRGDHLKAARMLVRVASSISKFPAHIVPILTSTVIECHRAGLRASAFKYAAILVKPEYRSQIDPKYQKKIEGLVRKPALSRQPRKAGDAPSLEGDVPEPTSPCPFCSFQLPETELHCHQCKALIPFCIATGRHIIKDDCTICSHCEFPGIHSELVQLLKSEDVCPMCGENLGPSSLSLITDFQDYLSTINEN